MKKFISTLLMILIVIFSSFINDNWISCENLNHIHEIEVIKKEAYINHCWRCYGSINSNYCRRCSKCGWYICNNCGACDPDCSRNSNNNNVGNNGYGLYEEDDNDDSLGLIVIGGIVIFLIYYYNKKRNN